MKKIALFTLILLFNFICLSQAPIEIPALKFELHKEIIDTVLFDDSYFITSKLINTSNQDILISFYFYNSHKYQKLPKVIKAKDTILVNWHLKNVTRKETNTKLGVCFYENGNFKTLESKNIKLIVLPLKYNNKGYLNLGDIPFNSVVKRKYRNYFWNLRELVFRSNSYPYRRKKKKDFEDVLDMDFEFSEGSLDFKIEIQNIWGNKGRFTKIYIFEFEDSIDNYILTVTGNFIGKPNDTTIYRIGFYDRHYYKYIYKENDLYIPPVKELIDSSINGAVIKFDSLVANYGIINKGADGVRYFTFTNAGNEPLVIVNAKSSCGCLVADWPRNPILPGKKATIKANYATNRVGKFRKTITVRSNAINNNIAVLRIKGEVLPNKKQGK